MICAGNARCTTLSSCPHPSLSGSHKTSAPRAGTHDFVPNKCQNAHKLPTCNPRAREAASTTPDYQNLVTQAPNLARGVLSLNIAQWMTCKMLFNTLRRWRCVVCGDFTSYIHFLSCTRVCSLCLSEHSAYRPISMYRAASDYKLRLKHLKLIPCMTSRPGFYSLNKREISGRIRLMNRRSAQRAHMLTSIVLVGSNRISMEVFLLPPPDGLGSERLAWQNHSFDRIAQLTDARPGNPGRFLAIINAPVFDLTTRSADWGFHRTLCRDENHKNRPRHWRRKFNMLSFPVHLIRWHNE